MYHAYHINKQLLYIYNDNISGINGIVSQKSNKSSPWKLATGNCLGKHPYLTAYHPNITTNEKNVQQWTANIRTMAISYTTGMLHSVCE